MPKQLDYPRVSLKAAFQLAKAVDELSGSCSPEMAAEKLGKKISGAFHALISSTVKYGLISNKSGRLSVQTLYRDYKLAYTDDERSKLAQKALLSIPLFQQITDKFSGSKLPVDHFEKYLIREMQVPEVIASRVATYFIEGAKLTGLMNPDYTFTNFSKEEAEKSAADDGLEPQGEFPALERDGLNQVTPDQSYDRVSRGFKVRIQGPGIDSMIEINESEDLLIVQAMLKKIEKRLAESNQPSLQ